MPSITTNRGDATAANADALVLPVYTGEPVASGLDARFDGHLAPILAAAGFTGKRGEVAAYPTFGALPARWLILTGLGERASAGGETLRRAYGAAIKRARDAGARTVAVAVPAGVDAEGVSAIVEGISLALYRFATYKIARGRLRQGSRVRRTLVCRRDPGGRGCARAGHRRRCRPGAGPGQHDLQRQDAAADRRVGAARRPRVRPPLRGPRREGARHRAATTASSPSARGAPPRPASSRWSTSRRAGRRRRSRWSARRSPSTPAAST